MKDIGLHEINQIQSFSLREVAVHLFDMGYKITHYGQTWTEEPASWIYFDTILDLNGLKEKFNLEDTIIIHENLDPKSGTERGFKDTTTGEGLMGNIG